jgi:hexosaminidase
MRQNPITQSAQSKMQREVHKEIRLHSCLLLIAILLFCTQAFSESQLPLIPYPQQVILTHGHLKFKTVNGMPQMDLKFIKQNDIALQNLLHNKPEGYKMVIGKRGIKIYFLNDSARIYAQETLVQLIFQYQASGKIPCCEIVDYPVFAWRGMHLDCSRHFFTKEEIKQYINMLALHKMNVFHWHLTDDQGWRIEIKKYPNLTITGAWRNGSMVGPYKDSVIDSIRYGGYYSQADIREVVNYAAAMMITVVPEIEMPGHSVAALAAYPEYACFPGHFETEKRWGVFEDVYCTKDSTLRFLEDILDEVCTLFPSKYIHIGGDECPKTRWKACPQCQARMRSLGLKDENELQSWFTSTIEKYLETKGKQVIGWDEILEGGLAPGAAVMSWRGEEGGIAAAKASHNVVMTPGKFCYFDHYQDTPVSKEPLAIGGYTSLENVYSYNPVPASLSAEESKYILGAQGNVWTEYITTFSQVSYMAVPRMCALAEVLWTYPSDRNIEDFKKRLERHASLLDDRKINYSKAFRKGN